MIEPGDYYRVIRRGLSPVVLPKLAQSALYAVVGGLAYGYATSYSPIPWINGVLTFFLGFFIGGSIMRASQDTGTQDPLFMGLVGAVLGLVADYAAWVAWVLAMSHHSTLILRPDRLLWTLVPPAEHGFIRHFQIIPFDIRLTLDPGFNAFVAWIEVAVLVATSAYTASRISDDVFCERCNRWGYWREVDPSFAPVENPDELRHDLEEGGHATLERLLGTMPYAGPTWTELVLERCHGCESLRLLTVRAVRKLERGRKSTFLVRRIQLDEPIFQKVAALCSNRD